MIEMEKEDCLADVVQDQTMASTSVEDVEDVDKSLGVDSVLAQDVDDKDACKVEEEQCHMDHMDVVDKMEE